MSHEQMSKANPVVPLIIHSQKFW